MIEVRTSYDFSLWPDHDKAIYAAAGRESDFSGAGMGTRDHGWVCQSEIEAAGISRALKNIGLAVETRPVRGNVTVETAFDAEQGSPGAGDCAALGDSFWATRNPEAKE